MAMATLMFLLFILLSHAASEKCNPDDKRALLQIKKDFKNPTFLSSWNPHTDCCDRTWKGVSCKYQTNRVQSLTLLNNNHPFQIPPSIGNLPYLEALFLYMFPNLTGPIPQAISKLTNLKFLTISSTSVSGPIPNFVSKLKSLIKLDLTENNLSGTLPPPLSQLHDLTGIFFDNNKFIGPIPGSYGSFNNLQTLSLSQNKLIGPIPMSFAKLKNLYYIDLSRNKLEGDASMLFGSTKRVAVMHLSKNLLAFDLGKMVFPK